jgi:hypothetical protein
MAIEFDPRPSARDVLRWVNRWRHRATRDGEHVASIQI